MENSLIDLTEPKPIYQDLDHVIEISKSFNLISLVGQDEISAEQKRLEISLSVRVPCFDKVGEGRNAIITIPPLDQRLHVLDLIRFSNATGSLLAHVQDGASAVSFQCKTRIKRGIRVRGLT